MHNDEEEIEIQANMSFGVKFGGNIVNVATEGKGSVYCKKLGETYEIHKRTPNLCMKNLILGKR